jgi:hypothetical protein
MIFFILILPQILQPFAQTTSSSHAPPSDVHQTGSLSNLACSSIASLDVSRYSESL